MKKLKILLLITAFALFISACGSDDSESSSTSNSDSLSSSSEASSQSSSSSSSSEPTTDTSSQSEEVSVDFTSYTETVSALNSDISFFEVDENIASTNLALNSLNVNQIFQLLDATGFVTDEIVVVITPSSEDATKVSAALEMHVAKLIEDFTEYNPQEVPKLESAIYYTEGNIAALFIGDYAQQYKDELLVFLEGVSL